jgi:hypothetical protein
MSARDPLERKAAADEVIERAASELRRLLHEAVAGLQPFPPFPGAFFTNASRPSLREQPASIAAALSYARMASFMSFGLGLTSKA